MNIAHTPWASAMLLRVLCAGLCMLNLSCQAAAEPLPSPSLLTGQSHSREIPAPETILGYSVGTQAVTHTELLGYCNQLAEASSRVTRTDYGQSHDGRRLFYLTITNPANHQRLDDIRQANARLADPRQNTTVDIAQQPAIAWLGYSIHGDELSSTDAAIYVAYHLAAAQDPNTRQLLRDTVIHMVPLMNPDGRQRFLGQIRQFTGRVANPDFQAMHHSALWTRGRGNHYLFDLNRDWLILEQPEVRQLAPLIKAWNPQLLVDSHEMFPNETYLFDPPNIPHNLHLNRTNMQWRTAFGADQARAFDRYGWSYYTRDWYTDWAPIYTNAWASLRDAIGLLYEQARADSSLAKYDTGQIMSYHDTVQHQVVSCLANLETLHQNRSAILKDFVAARQRAVTPQTDGPQVFLLPP
ncbi:M14 family zinc carboxypeptidase, partial [Planctomycetota bacterium]